MQNIMQQLYFHINVVNVVVVVVVVVVCNDVVVCNG